VAHRLDRPGPRADRELRMVARGVRERGIWSFGKAVQQLAQVPARLYGCKDRGELREGMAADLVVFDAQRVDRGPVESRADLPGGAARLYAEALAASRHCGIDEASQFCPLPAELRRHGDELYTLFSARYGTYVEQVVVPTIAAFRTCTSLIVLVDITMLPAGGVGMYAARCAGAQGWWAMLSGCHLSLAESHSGRPGAPGRHGVSGPNVAATRPAW